MDCDTSCPKPPEYPPDPLPFRIGNFDGYSVILIFVFIGFVIVFLIATYWVQSGSIGKYLISYRNISSMIIEANLALSQALLRTVLIANTASEHGLMVSLQYYRTLSL